MGAEQEMKEARQVVTRHVYPPIPVRSFDWLARWEGGGYDEENSPHGWGETEALAIADLQENYEP